MKCLLAACALLFATFATYSARADYCPAGYPNDCGNGRCCPSGFTCGGTCGGECCGSGNGGGGGGGGGNVCPAGFPNDCGNGRCCPSGTMCGGSCGGECCPTGGGANTGGGGSGVCPAGYPNDCGGNRCCPSGTTCGGSCGGECCPVRGGNDDYGGSYNGGQGPQTGGNHYVCQTTYVGSGCSTVKACAGPGEAWYDADGRRFECSGTSCASAAEEVAAYCDESSASSCSSSTSKMTPNGSAIAGAVVLGAMAVGLTRRRRRAAD